METNYSANLSDLQPRYSCDTDGESIYFLTREETIGKLVRFPDGTVLHTEGDNIEVDDSQVFVISSYEESCDSFVISTREYSVRIKADVVEDYIIDEDTTRLLDIAEAD